MENEWDSKRSLLPFGVGCWKGIMQEMESFKTATRIEVGSGTKTNFWKDSWCSSRPLMMETPNMYKLARNREDRVMDCWVPMEARGV